MMGNGEKKFASLLGYYATVKVFIMPWWKKDSTCLYVMMMMMMKDMEMLSCVKKKEIGAMLE